MNKIVSVCFTDDGAKLIEKLSDAMTDVSVMGCAAHKDNGSKLISVYKKVPEIIKDCFRDGIPILFVGACAIAVRYIAPYIEDKAKDIPVIVTDEKGRYVIPILSGHLGGANKLSVMIAAAISATPVNTTATDINETFAIDNFAVENDLAVQNKEKIKSVSKKALKGEPIIIAVRDYIMDEPYDCIISDDIVSHDALVLTQKKYVLGIGCKRGKSLKDIEAAADEVLSRLEIGYDDIYAVASIDLKADEEGLRDFSRKYRIPFFTFTADILKKAKGTFTPSEFVNDAVGVDNVCERAAVVLAHGGRLVQKKYARDGVTVAVAKRI